MESSPAIFVVEDDVDFREVLLEYLTSLGYEVRAFGSAEQLMLYLRNTSSGPPALVISDIHLVRATGFELARELRELRPELPIILITSFGNPDIEQSAVQLGASAYLEKPFQLSAISDLVRQFLPDS
jgi:DNA-binding NtrC family response regulator